MNMEQEIEKVQMPKGFKDASMTWVNYQWTPQCVHCRMLFHGWNHEARLIEHQEGGR
jgi:hypothetical protein